MNFSELIRTHSRAELAMIAIRLLLSLLIAIHGWARLLAGGVEPFGQWLDSIGIPIGLAVAIMVTTIEIVGTPVMAWGRLVLPLCTVYSAIYIVGIFLVHAPAGWFVVGLGRNGMEYSVLLVFCLACVGFQCLPQRKSTENDKPDARAK